MTRCEISSILIAELPGLALARVRLCYQEGGKLRNVSAQDAVTPPLFFRREPGAYPDYPAEAKTRVRRVFNPPLDRYNTVREGIASGQANALLCFPLCLRHSLRLV